MPGGKRLKDYKLLSPSDMDEFVAIARYVQQGMERDARALTP